MKLFRKVDSLAIVAYLVATLSTLRPTQAQDFMLSSPDIHVGKTIDKKHVFHGFGCMGDNVSPVLSWSHAPKGTKSFALTVYDPDAPSGSGWWHWVVFNIPADTRELPANAGNPTVGLMPKGVVQSRTDFGGFGYGGPCPPIGDQSHRYYFRLYALKSVLQLDRDVPAAQVGFQIHQNQIGEAEIMGVYGR